MSATPSRIRAVFIDDGDVMNDNSVRAPQWRTLIGDFFVPRLGGDSEAWAEANRVVFESQWNDVASGHGDEPFQQWWDRYQLLWMRGMAKRVGVGGERTDEEWMRLAREVSEFVTLNVRSAYPGAVDAIKQLSGRGFELHTASNEVSWELDGYLRGMGVRDLFGSLYGPDLIDADKHDAEYYMKMFRDSGVDPREAVVVDNEPDFLDRAAATDATTFQVAPGGVASDGSGHRVIGALSELPAAVEGLRK